VVQGTVEVAPGDAHRDGGGGGPPEAEADLGAALPRMAVAAVHLADLALAARDLGLDEGADGGGALAPGRVPVMDAQAGRRLVHKVPADLAACASAALSAAQREIGRYILTVETDLNPAPVVGDPGLLERLAGNLVENAVRYNHIHGRLWLRTGSDGQRSTLLVGNTGFEVEPPDLPGLFEPFRRGGRERTGARGSGLGLSIVRAVCDAHGGTVSAVALDGGGLEVTVTLPAAATTPVAAGSAAVRAR